MGFGICSTATGHRFATFRTAQRWRPATNRKIPKPRPGGALQIQKALAAQPGCRPLARSALGGDDHEYESWAARFRGLPQPGRAGGLPGWPITGARPGSHRQASRGPLRAVRGGPPAIAGPDRPAARRPARVPAIVACRSPQHRPGVPTDRTGLPAGGHDHRLCPVARHPAG